MAMFDDLIEPRPTKGGLFADLIEADRQHDYSSPEWDGLATPNLQPNQSPVPLTPGVAFEIERQMINSQAANAEGLLAGEMEFKRDQPIKHDMLTNSPWLEGRIYTASAAANRTAAGLLSAVSENLYVPGINISSEIGSGIAKPLIQPLVDRFNDTANRQERVARSFTPDGLAGFFTDITDSTAQMALSVLATAATKNPNIGLSIMGTQIGGKTYQESLNEGKSNAEAMEDAVFATALELGFEKFFGFYDEIAKPIGGLKGIFRTAGIESASELSTEAGTILDESIRQGKPMPDVSTVLARLGKAGSSGLIMGGLLSTPSNIANRNPVESIEDSVKKINEGIIAAAKANRDAEFFAKFAANEARQTVAQTVEPTATTSRIVAPTSVSFDLNQPSPTQPQAEPQQTHPSAPLSDIDQLDADLESLEAETAPQAPQQDIPAETVDIPGEAAPAGLISIPATQLQTDAEAYQYKQNADEEGVSERLKGVKQWDPIKAGIVIVHQRNDGNLYVADGHQRTGLARRLAAETGQDPMVNAIVLKESDGYTVERVRAIAAAKNIAEGSGTPWDAAKVFREAGNDQDMLDSMPKTGALVRDGLRLAKLDPEVMQSAINNDVDPTYAGMVGDRFDEPDMQKMALQMILRLDPRTQGQTAVLLEDVASAAVKADQIDMFGGLDERVIKERMKLLDRVRANVERNKSLMGSLLRNQGTIESAAKNIVDADGTEAVRQRAEMAAQIIKGANTDPETNAYVGEQAQAVVDGKITREQAAKNIRQKLEERIERGESYTDDGAATETDDDALTPATDPGPSLFLDVTQDPGSALSDPEQLRAMNNNSLEDQDAPRETSGFKLFGQTVTERPKAPQQETTGDMFGGATQTQQDLHRRKLEKDAGLRGEQVDVTEGDGNLFVPEQFDTDRTQQNLNVDQTTEKDAGAKPDARGMREADQPDAANEGSPQDDGGSGIEFQRGTGRKSAKADDKSNKTALIGRHNLSADNLLFAARMGGIPVPSIAVTPASQPFDGYGEITLLTGRELVNPESGAQGFDSDIYSTRVPRPKHTLNGSVERAIGRIVNSTDTWREVPGSTGQYVTDREFAAEGMDSVYKLYGRDYGLMTGYLQDIGAPLKRIPKKQKHPDEFIEFKQTDAYKALGEKPGYHELQDAWEAFAKRHKTASQWKYYGGNIQDKIQQANAKEKTVDKDRLKRIIDRRLTRAGGQKAFNKWAQKKFGPLLGEQYIENGRGRKRPFTLENLVDAVGAQVIGKESVIVGGLGVSRARGAKKFRSIEEARANIDRVMPKERVRNIIDALKRKFTDKIATGFESKYTNTFELLDGLTNSIGDYLARRKNGNVSKRQMEGILRRRGIREVTPGAVADLLEFAEEIRNAPTEYFEFRQPRAVSISDFAGAVIPKNASKEVKDALREAGVPYRLYDSKTQGDRQRVIDEWNKGNIRFSRERGDTSKSLAGLIDDNAGRGAQGKPSKSKEYKDAPDQSSVRTLEADISEYTGKAVPEGTYRAVQITDRANARLAETIKRIYGKDVVLFTKDGSAGIDFNGVSIPSSPNVLYINADSPDLFKATAGHELVHTIRKTNPALYRRIASLVEKYSDDAGLTKYRQYSDELQQKHGDGKLSEGQMREEFVADAVGDMFADPSFVKRLTAKEKTIWQRFAQAVMNAIDSVVNRISGKFDDVIGIDEYIPKYEALKKELADLMLTEPSMTPINQAKYDTIRFSIGRKVAEGQGELFVNKPSLNTSYAYARTAGLERVGTMSGPAKVVTNADVASLTRSLAKKAQENVIIVGTDNAGNVLGIVRTSIGSRNSAQVDIKDIIGPMYRLGATKAWMVHNHPSENPDQSSADEFIFKKIGNITKGTGLDFVDSIVVSGNSYSSHYAMGGKPHDDSIKESNDVTLDVQERVLESNPDAPWSPDQPILITEDAIRLTNAVYKGGEVLLLLDNQNRYLGQVQVDDPSRMRSGDTNSGLGKILQAIDESNATRVIHVGKANSKNLATALREINVEIIDVIVPNGDGNYSSFSAYNTIPAYDDNGVFFQRGKGLSERFVGRAQPGLSDTGFINWTMPARKWGDLSVKDAQTTLQKITTKVKTSSRDARIIFQDKLLPIKEAVEQARKTGTVTEFSEVYMRAENAIGKIGDKLDRLQENSIEPLVDGMRKYGISQDQLGEYLYARHAKERNRVIAKRNPNYANTEKSPGSGLSDSQADAILTKYADNAKMQELAGIVDGIISNTKQTLLDSGLVKPEHFNLEFKHYIPLKGSDSNDTRFEGTGSGFDTKAKDIYAALGRETPAKDILPQIIADAERAIIRASKNEVGQSLLRLALDNPNPGLWSVNKVEVKRELDPATGMVVEKLARKWIGDNIFITKVNGKSFAIELDPQLAKSMKNLGAENLNIAFRGLAKINRWLSYANTALNPEFTYTNFWRDLESSLVQLDGEYGRQMSKGVLKDVMSGGPALGAFASLEGKSKLLKKALPKKVREWEEWFERYRASGGKISYFRQESIPEQRNRIEKLIKQAQRNPRAYAGLAARETVKFIENLNGAIENAVRVATYRNAIEQGYSETKAAHMARELTVNFNRRGEHGVLINSAYLFYNASIQGTARYMTALKHKGVRKLIYRAMAGQAALTVYNYMIAGDDEDGENRYEKIPDYEKARNLIIMLPGNDEPIKIPMPYGYNALMAIPENMVAVGFGRRPGKAVANVGTAFWNSFNPLADNGILNTIAPTILDPFIEIEKNRNFFGNMIAPEDFPFDDFDQPNSDRYFDSVNPQFKRLAKLINSATGGTDTTARGIDISPEWIEHFWDTYTGAAGAFVQRSVTFAQDPVEAFNSNKVPMLRKFYGANKQFYVRDQYNKAGEMIAAAQEQSDRYKKQRDIAGYRQHLQDNRNIMKLAESYKQTEKQIAQLRRQKNKIKENKTISKKEREKRIDLYNEKIDSYMIRFNRRYNETLYFTGEG